MKWHPHVKFAMPGVIALFFVAVFQKFIPPEFRSLAFASVALTLILGLVTGQFHRMAQEQKAKEEKRHPSQPDQEDTLE
ncbi:MAG: hypothetical protein ACYS8Z_02875 [Planctomycetota bacterium]|jgi:uncharacterized membrane protein